MKGHVYKRGNSWTYVFDGPPDPLTGERTQITKGAWETEKAAWSAVRTAIKLAEEGRHVRPSNRTLGVYVDEWLQAIKPATAATTWGNWKVYAHAYVIPTLGQVKLQSLSAPQLQAFYAHLLSAGRVKADLSTAMYIAWQKAKRASKTGREPTARQVAEAAGTTLHAAYPALRRFRAGWVPDAKGPGLAPKTVRNIHIMLHTALANAVGWKYVVDNVAEHVNPPRVPRRKHSVWTPSQLRKFLDFVQSDRFYPLYLVAATTGLRRSELCGLRWPAIDLDMMTISIEPDTLVVVNGKARNSDGKTDRAPRQLALDPATAEALREWRTAQESERAFFGRDYLETDRVFTWENGRDVHPDVIRQRFNRSLQRCGLPRIRLYDMRHTYATIALKSGIHPKIISARLGHASEAFTMATYQSVMPGMDKQAAVDVAGLILGQPDV
jgi:integrase